MMFLKSLKKSRFTENYMIVNLDKIQAVVVLQKENKNKNTNQTLNIENFTFFFP